MPGGGARYRIVYFGPLLGLGVGDGRHVSLSAVAKSNSPNTPYCVANEVICAEIGRFLGLPIPPAGVIYAPNGTQLFYASLDFNLAGNDLPPVNVTKCVKLLPKESAGVLLFDMLIANSDRHGQNFSVDFLSRPPKMNVFDHGHAMFGKDTGKGGARLHKLRDRLAVSGGSLTQGNRHSLIDQIDSDVHFGYWLDRMKQIPDFFIEDLCQEVVGLGCDEKEAEMAISFLKYRRAKLGQIIQANKNEFPRIRSWRLFQ
ncbi:hypothetical protein SBA7_80016 [Candidatus Sulfotelmatobacter sp. SbA7]|nr:hypothetical protein SBA7_80016 [Candidatus Sulfotelmatobacter sp. SbA7]